MSGLSLYGSGLTITEAQGPNYYLGTWNASTNTPTLTSSVAPAGPAGSYYIVSVSGTTTLNGISDWTVGDWAIWSGSVWQKLEGGATAVTVGSTAIAGGTTGRVLYDNAGTLGEYAVTGASGSVVLSGAPTITTPIIGSTTWANIPAAGAAGKMAFVSNAGTKGSMWLDDGTRWKPLNGAAILATLDSATGNIANTATIVLQYLIPAGMWQTGDVIRVQGTFEKSGTTDTGIVTIYIGTAGTTSDTTVLSSTWLAATSLAVDYFVDYRLDAATTVQQVSMNTGYSAASSNQFLSYTISSAAANDLYVSLAFRSGGTTNTVLSRYASISLFSKAN